MRRLRIRTTEIEVDVSEQELASIVSRTLRDSAPTVWTLPPALDSAQTEVATALEPADSPPIALKPRPKAKSRQTSRRTDSGAQDERHDIVARIVGLDIPEHESYNAALRSAAKTIDKALLILRLAQGNDVRSLVSAEITRILGHKFALPEKENAVRMALMRGAKLRPPLVAPERSGRRNLYWLTQPGADRVAKLLNPSTV